jgi:hypothetical protein
VLAFGLAFVILAGRMTTRERASAFVKTTADKAGEARFRGPSLKAGDFRHSAANLILQSDTVCGFSGIFGMIRDDAKVINPCK